MSLQLSDAARQAMIDAGVRAVEDEAVAAAISYPEPVDVVSVADLLARVFLSLPEVERRREMTGLTDRNYAAAYLVRRRMEDLRAPAAAVSCVSPISAYVSRIVLMQAPDRDRELAFLQANHPDTYQRVRTELRLTTISASLQVDNPPPRYIDFDPSYSYRPADRVAVPVWENPAVRPLSDQFNYISDHAARMAACMTLLPEEERVSRHAHFRRLDSAFAARVIAWQLASDRYPDCFGRAFWQDSQGGARHVDGECDPALVSPPPLIGTITHHSTDGTSERVEIEFRSEDSVRQRAEQMNASPLSTPPSAVRSVIDAFEVAARQREMQRVSAGDWVAFVVNTKQFTKLDQTQPHRESAVMPPGRPLTYITKVLRTWREPDEHTQLVEELITVEVRGQRHIGKRVLPGASDSPLLLPCARPNCSRPHLNNHPYCRNCVTQQVTDQVLTEVSTRLDELRACRAMSHLADETKAAIDRDTDVLGQFVMDHRARMQRERREQERRQRIADERARQNAMAEEEKEKELLAQLMAKHGIKAQKPKPSGGNLPEGERNLEL